MRITDPPSFRPNWTTAAGALEGILDWLGAPLPRHAIMGLSGHAWHTCLDTREGSLAAPSGPSNLDWAGMAAAYARTGVPFERYDGPHDAALDWARGRLDEGKPLIASGFDFHEFAIVHGAEGDRFFVDSLLTSDAATAPEVLAATWPGEAAVVELLSPLEPQEADPGTVIVEALQAAVDGFSGRDGPPDAPRGTAALDAWADALAGRQALDRNGNAYMLAVTQSARLDGAQFLDEIASAFEDATAIEAAASALRDEAHELSQLITFFPYPSGGDVTNIGLRRVAADHLRRAADHERKAAAFIAAALEGLTGLAV